MLWFFQSVNVVIEHFLFNLLTRDDMMFNITKPLRGYWRGGIIFSTIISSLRDSIKYLKSIDKTKTPKG
jgi:hypothetical protein